MDFQNLLQRICQTHETLSARAASAINQSLVVRNWLMGFFIVEFEQNGRDYPEYGQRLLYRVSEELERLGIKAVSYTNLTLYRKFYLVYPQFADIVIQFPELSYQEKPVLPILQTTSEESSQLELKAERLLRHFSFSHFVEFLKVEESQRRIFYEIEAIKGNWTVRQLRRQINSLLYERTGLSKNKEALLAMVNNIPLPLTIAEVIREPYVFEFSGLKTSEVFLEKDLEKALLDHLQEFILELGTGFCFEARQKSFLIDNRRYKVDLLFYHRILKCHVVFDLKTGEFTHEDAGQMNFYLNYHKDNLMAADDNLPVGVILCMYKNEAVVRYATGSLDNKLFVSKYLLQLPGEETLRKFILEEKQLLEENP